MHIDWWTLALQTINVLILVWILARFLYRPVADVIEQRRVAAAKVLTDASAMRAAADAGKADVEATRAGFAAERDSLLANARKKIEIERAAMLREATDRIESLRCENEVVLARERSSMEAAIIEQAAVLAVQIARKLLERLPAQAAPAVFLNALSEQIKALPPKSGGMLAASARDGALSVVTASPLGETEQRQCQRVIEDALGAKAEISFRVDPRLIAGVELSAGALVFKNNWQNDLSQILQQLKRDDGQPQIS